MQGNSLRGFAIALGVGTGLIGLILLLVLLCKGGGGNALLLSIVWFALALAAFAISAHTPEATAATDAEIAKAHEFALDRQNAWLLIVVALAAAVMAAVTAALLGGITFKNSDGEKPKAHFSATGPNTPIVWAQLRPDDGNHHGQLIARAIVASKSECPEIVFDGPGFWSGKRGRLNERFAPQGDFAIKVCEMAYPGHLAAKVGSVRLEPRPDDPKTIVLIGDTGCRITERATQNCKNAAEWPFKAVATAAADHKPDLIIHVGDYHYREAECRDAAKCGGSPWGDKWTTWQKEFFEPAAPLLARAPWLMMRGNHEGWTRAGNGWQLLLSPHARDPMGSPWPDEDLPYALRFKELTLAVADAANSDDKHDPDARADRQSKRLATFWSGLAEKTSTPAVPTAPATPANPTLHWLLMHQPAWVSFSCKEKKEDKDPSACAEPKDRKAFEAKYDTKKDRTIEAVQGWLRDGTPAPRVDLMLSGDTHMFQFFVPNSPGNAPPQIIAGMSGTMLDKDSYGTFRDINVETDLFGIGGRLWMHLDFGFVVLTKDAGKWKATLYDSKGGKIATCDPAADGDKVCTK